MTQREMFTKLMKDCDGDALAAAQIFAIKLHTTAVQAGMPPQHCAALDVLEALIREARVSRNHTK